MGLRYDRFASYYPKQATSSNLIFPDLFPPGAVAASGNIVEWNNVAPRIGVAFDVTGRGTSVIRVSYGRFYKLEGTGLVETVNPVGSSSKTFTWVDGNGDKIPQVGEWKVGNPTSVTGGAAGTRIDPKLKRPYSDEFSINYEHQVWGDLRLGAAYYFRKKKNLFGQVNTSVSPSDYTAVTVFDDGTPIVNPLNGSPLTLFNLAVAKTGQFTNVITNIPELDDNTYHGVEFTANKRLSNHWQVLGGFTIQRQKGAFGRGYNDDSYFDNFNDPNNDVNRRNNILNQDSTYVFKVDSTYELPWKLSTSVNFQHYTGYPIQPVANLGGGLFPDPNNAGAFLTQLKQGSEQIILQPAGPVRLPGVNLLNLRIAREFAIGERFKIKPLIDLFNITNSQTVIAKNATLPSTFGDPDSTYLQPQNTINPFIARIGLNINF